jgi:fructosamine-3-kinase
MSGGAARGGDGLDAALRGEVEAALGARIEAATPVGGGDINQAARLRLAGGGVAFLKHHRAPPSGLFAAEARGLAWLAEPDAIRVPRVLGHGERFLALEWLEPAPPRADHDEALGRGLARLHAAHPPGLGLAEDNFLATLPQDNRPTADWPSFWMERRLLPTARRAVDAGRGPRRWLADLERLAAAVPGLAGPAEPPARLHGDLWSGNLVVGPDGGPALVDPAVYGGHREVDLAMLALFGTVSPRTRAAYQEVWPLADGWRERVPLWQLYPLLVHVVLFGGGYAASVERALGRLL